MPAHFPNTRQRNAAGLSVAEAAVLAVLRRYIARTGEPPSFRALCAELGWTSLATAATRLTTLVRRGAVVRHVYRGAYWCYYPAQVTCPAALLVAFAQVRAASQRLAGTTQPGEVPVVDGRALREWQDALAALRAAGWVPEEEL